MGDVATWDDQGSQLENPKVWPMAENKLPFDIQKENDVFFYVQNNFMDWNCASMFFDILLFDDGPVLEIPPSFDQPLQRKTIEKVSNFKIFFKSCLSLVKYKDVMEELLDIIWKNSANSTTGENF